MNESNELQLSPISLHLVWVALLLFYFIGSPILAIYNLMHYEAPFDPIGILSAIWLFVILATVVTVAPELPRTVMGFITSFSNDRFVVVRYDRQQRAWLCFGCRLFGFTIWSKRIAADSIEEVRLFQGQASGLAGRDMDDWQPLIRSGADGRTPYFDGSPQAREGAEIDLRKIELALRSA